MTMIVSVWLRICSNDIVAVYVCSLFCNITTPSTTRLGLDSTFQVNYRIDKYGLVGIIQNLYANNYASALFTLEFVPEHF